MLENFRKFSFLKKRRLALTGDHWRSLANPASVDFGQCNFPPKRMFNFEEDLQSKEISTGRRFKLREGGLKKGIFDQNHGKFHAKNVGLCSSGMEV